MMNNMINSMQSLVLQPTFNVQQPTLNVQQPILNVQQLTLNVQQPTTNSNILEMSSDGRPIITSQIDLSQEIHLPALYKVNDRNLSYIWNVSVLGSVLIKRHGRIDGKQIESRKEIQAKGVGVARKTPQGQAIFEAGSDWRKKRDEGYTTVHPGVLKVQAAKSTPSLYDINGNINIQSLVQTSVASSAASSATQTKLTIDDDALAALQNGIQLLPMDTYTQPLTAMLAYEYNSKKIKEWPVAVMPKLDGVRGIATRIQTNQGPDVAMTSRNNKPYVYMRKVKRELVQIFNHLPKGTKTDGEGYNPDIDFQKLISVARKSKNIDKDDDILKYYMFDLIPTSRLPFVERHKMLTEAFNKCMCTVLEIVPYKLAYNHDDVKKAHDEYVAAGYEGVIVRVLNSEYIGRRSNHLLKYKEFYDAEFPIIGFKEGEGNQKGCVIFQCGVKDTHGQDRSFDVVPKGTLEVKRDMFNNGNTYLGKKLTVRYQELTNDGLPRFPIGIAVRDYE
jgi:hypothetical protein